jgi:hypothetical protein
MSSLGMPEQYKGDWKEIEVPPLAPEEPEVPAFPHIIISIHYLHLIICQIIVLFVCKIALCYTKS